MDKVSQDSIRTEEAVEQRRDETMPFTPRVGCLISSFFAAIPVCLILGAVTLAMQGEFTFELGPVREARVWMIREGQEQGVGWSTMKRTTGNEVSNTVCYQTSVHFLLWKSLQVERQALYCESYRLDAGGWQYAGECP